MGLVIDVVTFVVIVCCIAPGLMTVHNAAPTARSMQTTCVVARPCWALGRDVMCPLTTGGRTEPHQMKRCDSFEAAARVAETLHGTRHRCFTRAGHIMSEYEAGKYVGEMTAMLRVGVFEMSIGAVFALLTLCVMRTGGWTLMPRR